MTRTMSRSAAHDRAEPPERQPFFGLSPYQLAGGALAAISSAVVSSYLGVAGTLTGAALGSVVSTAGAAIYTQSMKSAHSRISSGIQAAGHGQSGTPLPGTQSATATYQPATARLAATPETTRLEASPAHRGPGGDVLVVDTRRGFLSGLWLALRTVPRRVWLSAAAVFVFAIAVITAFEVLTGRPVSATVSGSQTSGGTSISSFAGAGPAPTSVPSPEATQAPSAGVPGPAATGEPGQDSGQSATSEATAAGDDQSAAAESPAPSEPAATSQDGSGEAGSSAQPTATQATQEARTAAPAASAG